MELPRDLQLKVLQKLDMDGRVRLGIIGKLKVPETLSEAITAGLQKRISIPTWILEMSLVERQRFIDNQVALRIPISNMCSYDRYYSGSWLFRSQQQMRSIRWIKFAAVIYEGKTMCLCGFPDVQGLPTDFVEANPQWVVDYPEDDWRIFCQPGSAFRTKTHV
jgi:hypothetical protein